MELIVFYVNLCLCLRISFFIFQHFEVPLSLTMAHLIVKFMVAAFLRTLLSIYLKEDRVLLPWGENLKRIAPTGYFFIHVYGNWFIIFQPKFILTILIKGNLWCKNVTFYS